MNTVTEIQNTQSTEACLAAAITVARRSEDLDRTIAALAAIDCRASYLAFVGDWKARLAVLVADIRALKASCKGPGDHSLDQSRRQTCRVEARAMMLVRRATKAKAAAARRPALAA